MDPFEEAQRSERELLEATRRLEEQERQIEEDSRNVDENMRIAFAAARRADIPAGLGESTIPPSWWSALGEPRDLKED